jgi:hypothetical protein
VLVRVPPTPRPGEIHSAPARQGPR